MRFLFIDPALRQTKPIELSPKSAGPVFSLHELTEGELYVTAELLISGFDAWHSKMLAASHTGELEIDIDSFADYRPAWKVHNGLLFKSLTTPDLPPEQWACVRCCEDHHITLTQRTLVYGYIGAAIDVLMRRLDGSSLRTIHRNLHSEEAKWLEEEGIIWNTEGNTPLLPCKPDGDLTEKDFNQHFCHSASPTDDSPPTQDPHLRKLFTKER